MQLPYPNNRLYSSHSISGHCCKYYCMLDPTPNENIVITSRPGFLHFTCGRSVYLLPLAIIMNLIISTMNIIKTFASTTVATMQRQLSYNQECSGAHYMVMSMRAVNLVELDPYNYAREVWIRETSVQ